MHKPLESENMHLILSPFALRFSTLWCSIWLQRWIIVEKVGEIGRVQVSFFSFTCRRFHSHLLKNESATRPNPKLLLASLETRWFVCFVPNSCQRPRLVIKSNSLISNSINSLFFTVTFIWGTFCLSRLHTSRSNVFLTPMT